jgi:ABC-2 type transport system permease protein
MTTATATTSTTATTGTALMGPVELAHRQPVAALLADALVFARRHAEHIRQIPEKLIDVTAQPIVFVLLFAFVFGGAIAVEGGSYREYLIGGILVHSLAFGMFGPAMTIATELQEGVIDRFRSLPVARSAYLVGHVLAELVANLLAITILVGCGLAIGWRTHTDAWHVAHALVLLVVFAAVMVWIGTWLGMAVRSPDAVQGIGFVLVFPLTFVSSAFVPIASMPEALQWVASLNPVSTLAAAARELFGNPVAPVTKDVWPATHPVAASWTWCLVLLAVVVPATLHRFQRRTSG